MISMISMISMTQINQVEKKNISDADAGCLLKKTDYHAKITEIEDKIPSTFGLGTSAALTAVENKIPELAI